MRCTYKNNNKRVYAMKGEINMLKRVKIIMSYILVVVACGGLFPAKVEAASNRPIEDGVYYIVSALNTGKAVDVSGGSTKSGANIQLYNLNNSGAQQFKFTYKNGYYTITNVNSGKVLDVQGGGTASGTNVWQYYSNNSNAQKWKLVSLGNGYYYIKARCGLYLDVSGGRTSNGTNIQVYRGNGTKSQIFKLVPQVQYTYRTIKFDCTNLEAWKKSVMSAGKYNLSGTVVAQNVLSYKTVKVKVPVTGPSVSGKTSYRTINLKLPYTVEYKLHTHTLNKGFGRSWIYTNNGIQMLETCSCGYRKEGLFWEIPDLTEASSSQTSKSVISRLPSFK